MKAGEKKEAATVFDLRKFFGGGIASGPGKFLKMHAVGDDGDGVFQAAAPEIFGLL